MLWLPLLLLYFAAVSPLVIATAIATAIIIVTVATTAAAIAVVQRMYNCFHAMLPYTDTASILLKYVY